MNQERWQGRISRRALLRGAVLGGAGLAAAAIFGCGDSKSASTSKETANSHEGIINLGGFQLGVKSWEEQHSEEDQKLVVVRAVLKNTTNRVLSTQSLVKGKAETEGFVFRLEASGGFYEVKGASFYGPIPTPTLDFFTHGSPNYSILEVPPEVGLLCRLEFEVPKEANDYWLVANNSVEGEPALGKMRKGEIAFNFPFREPDLRIRESSQPWQIPGLATIEFKGINVTAQPDSKFGVHELFASFEIRNDSDQEMRITDRDLNAIIFNSPNYQAGNFEITVGGRGWKIETVSPGPIGHGLAKKVNVTFDQVGPEALRQILKRYENSVVFLNYQGHWAAWRGLLQPVETQPLPTGTPKELMVYYVNKVLKPQFRPSTIAEIFEESKAPDGIDQSLVSRSWKVGESQFTVKYYFKNGQSQALEVIVEKRRQEPLVILPTAFENVSAEEYKAVSEKFLGEVNQYFLPEIRGSVGFTRDQNGRPSSAYFRGWENADGTFELRAVREEAVSFSQRRVLIVACMAFPGSRAHREEICYSAP